MDDREFSSPVCYLDYDHYEVPAAKPVQPAFCTTCTAFIAALNTNATERNETNIEALSSGKKLKFILNGEGSVYKTTENIAVNAAEGCPLCVVIFEGLTSEEMEKLMSWRGCEREIREGAIFEFKGEIRGGGIRFRLISSPSQVPSSAKVKNPYAGKEKRSRDSTGSSQDIKLPLR